MMIITGLGNPGEKFSDTRHNIGFMILDFFAKKNNFPEFKMLKKYESLISEKAIETDKEYHNSDGRQNYGTTVILVKPQTFMNESGRAAKKIVLSFKIQASSLIVVHDDIDLILGKMKFSKDSGSGGHKGLDSIINHLGNKDFIRLKVGICPQKGKPKNVEKFVIQKFKEEETTLNKVIEKSAQALDYLVKNGLEKTMNEYNR